MKKAIKNHYPELTPQDILYLRGLLKLRRYSLTTSSYSKSEKRRITNIDTKLETVLTAND